MDEATLAQLYHDLQARSVDDDAIQRAVLRTLRRVPPPRDPVMFARGVLWKLTNDAIKARKTAQKFKDEWEREVVQVTPAQALARAEAREALTRMDPRLALHVLGVVRVSKRTLRRLKGKTLARNGNAQRGGAL